MVGALEQVPPSPPPSLPPSLPSLHLCLPSLQFFLKFLPISNSIPLIFQSLYVVSSFESLHLNPNSISQSPLDPANFLRVPYPNTISLITLPDPYTSFESLHLNPNALSQCPEQLGPRQVLAGAPIRHRAHPGLHPKEIRVYRRIFGSNRLHRGPEVAAQGGFKGRVEGGREGGRGEESITCT